MQPEDFADLPVPRQVLTKFLLRKICFRLELPSSNALERILQKLDKDQLVEITGLPVQRLLNVPEEALFGHAVRKMDVELPNGMVFRDVQNDDDAARVVQILKGLNLSTGPMGAACGGQAARL